eukprot:scaffold13851_cov124-Isochrysis_galbana.AAC.3
MEPSRPRSALPEPHTETKGLGIRVVVHTCARAARVGVQSLGWVDWGGAAGAGSTGGAAGATHRASARSSPRKPSKIQREALPEWPPLKS